MGIKKDFGRYEVKSLLGKGGFGTVYEAFDRKLNRTVALKVLNKGSKEGLSRFRREADICLRLRHPNVITIYDAAIRDDEPFIVMERLEAEDLCALLIKGDIGENEALSIIVQIANAIAYLEKEAILHRDIKPENIMVTTSGRAVLMDFNLGLAENMTALTATGIVVGTSRYMAPELWFGEPYTIASEIYALALVFYFMLTRTPPPNHSVAEIKKGLGPLEPPSSINPKLSKDYDDFLAWVTHPDCNLRCQSIEEFLLGLSKTTKSAACVVKKHNPELAATEKQVVIPPASLEPGEKLSSNFRLMALIVLFAIIAFVTQHLQSHRKNTIFSNNATERDLAELSLCPFPDGCYALYKGKQKEPPSWKILDRKGRTRIGKCSGSERFWEVETNGLTGEGKHRLQIFSHGEVLVDREFNIAKTPFKRPLVAFIGHRQVRLEWKLKGDVRARIVGRFTGKDDRAKQILARNEASFSTHEKAMYFKYDFFVGKRMLLSHKVRLSLVSRRNAKQFPGRPKWKVLKEPLVVTKGIVVCSGNGLSLLGIDRDGQGPVISLRWQRRENEIGEPLGLFAEDGNWFHCLWAKGKNLIHTRLNSTTTSGKGFGPGEWKLLLSDKNEPTIEARAILVRPGMVVVVSLTSSKEALLQLVDFRSEPVSIIQKNTLGSAEGIWFGQVKGGLGCITSSNGNVSYTPLLLNDGDRRVTLGKRQELFSTNNEGKVLTIHSQKKNATKDEGNRMTVEMDVTALSNGRWAIRLGGRISFFKLNDSQSTQCGPQIDLPVTVAERTSSALDLDDGSVAFALVKSQIEPLPKSRTFLYMVDLTRPAAKAVKKRLIDESAVHLGYEAICGGVGRWKSIYYVPALEYVHIISAKNGRTLGKLNGEWRPNFAIPFDGTLFVPLNTRRLLAMDLLDEF